MTWDPARFFPAFERAGLLHVARYQPRFGAAKEFSVDFVQPDVVALDGQVQAPETVIEYMTTDAPDLAAGVEVTVCGQRYTLRGAPRAVRDGFFSQAWLAKA
jgi:hypothetical protein